MSKYTTEVRWICESKSGFTEEELKTKTVDQIIAAARTQIFNFSWDSYNDTWKEAIEKFILKYYYTREIGLETVGLWQLKLSVRLDEIADKYNTIIQMIEDTRDEDQKLHYDQLLGNIDVESYAKVESSGESKDKYSDTPQGSLANVENDTYLTDYRDIENEGESETTATEKGYRGTKTKAELLTDSNLDALDVLNRIALEFDDLFFKLW
ncbi:MAG: hypothetical protein IKE92_14705 [Clostridiales bacterium]|nr:hypothetical protein [Clostridiales bacterium]